MTDRRLRVRGQVRSISEKKGFGFIRPDDGANDCFFHYSALEGGLTFDGLRVGTRVTFEISTGSGKGPRAEHIQPDGDD